MHKKNLHLLDSVYGLHSVDYLCLKVEGCHHSCFDQNSIAESSNGFGFNIGGCFYPADDSFGGSPCFEFKLEEGSSHCNVFIG